MAQRVLKQGNPKVYPPRIREGKIHQGQIPNGYLNQLSCHLVHATLTIQNSDLARMKMSVHLHHTSQLRGTLTLISRYNLWLCKLVFCHPTCKGGDQGLARGWDICSPSFLVLRRGWQAMRVKYPLNLAELSVNQYLSTAHHDIFPPSPLKSPMSLGETTKRSF